MLNQFLPVCKQDMEDRGWERCDFVLVTGDAYVDHPSFGGALIGRVLESHGYKVGIIAQPNWRALDSFKILGRPKLAFLVTSGNIDSMVNHYTVAKKPRKSDAYSPGGKGGLRPDRATIVYANRVREAYKKTPIILGGIEASLRRLAHYDYWDDRIRRSILLDANADLLVYGMGERPIVEIAHGLQAGLRIQDLSYIRGTASKAMELNAVHKPVILPTFAEILESKTEYAKSFKLQYDHTDWITAAPLVEDYGGLYVVQNPPAEPLTSDELDSVYLMPFTKQFHPVYTKAGGIPALKEVKYSLVSARGCFGGCNFCALNFHQGRSIQARKASSIIDEAKQMIKDPDFKGYIHDVGGPTANFRHKACEKQVKHGVCTHKQCLFPQPCVNLNVDHQEYLDLLRALRSLPGVKKVFVRSGIRYDYLISDQNQEFFQELCEHHISGQLKVAPEHISPTVLRQMGKPNKATFQRFVRKYDHINQKLGKKQFLVPYFMSSHPGSDLKTAIELAEYIRDMGYIPEQVQDFYPTPGTLSTCMYYTEKNPVTKQPVFVAKTAHEKAMQRALIQYKNPKNYDLVVAALKLAKRTDLIGNGEKCLVKPRRPKPTRRSKQGSTATSKRLNPNA